MKEQYCSHFVWSVYLSLNLRVEALLKVALTFVSGFSHLRRQKHQDNMQMAPPLIVSSRLKGGVCLLTLKCWWSYKSTALSEESPLEPRSDRLQLCRCCSPFLFFFYFPMLPVALPFPSHNMYCIALTFTAVSVGSLPTRLPKRLHPTAKRGREISHGDKCEERAGGQRWWALSKGTLAFVQ